MKFFEKNIKERFNEATSKDGVNADELWANIAGALPAEQVGTKVSSKQSTRKLLLLLLLFNCFGFLAYHFFYVGNEGGEIVERVEEEGMRGRGDEGEGLRVKDEKVRGEKEDEEMRGREDEGVKGEEEEEVKGEGGRGKGNKEDEEMRGREDEGEGVKGEGLKVVVEKGDEGKRVKGEGLRGKGKKEDEEMRGRGDEGEGVKGEGLRGKGKKVEGVKGKEDEKMRGREDERKREGQRVKDEKVIDKNTVKKGKGENREEENKNRIEDREAEVKKGEEKKVDISKKTETASLVDQDEWVPQKTSENSVVSGKVNRVSVLPLSDLMRQDIPLTFSIKNPTLNPLLENIKLNPKNKVFGFGVFSGLNLWKNNYQQGSSTNDTDKLLQEANSYELGHSFSVETYWYFYKNIYLTSGLEYVKTRNEFDYVQTWDTVMFRNNVPGSDLINAKATRTVKHHNQQTFFAMPIMVGGSKRLGRFDVGMSAGIALNIFTAQSGRSLNADHEIITYPNTESTLSPYTNFFLSYQVRPFVNYRINDYIFLQVRPEVKFQSHGKSSLHGVNHSSLLTGFSFGVVYAPR